MSSIAIVWLRRDLRIADNPALHHARARAERVIPLYIHAPDEEAPWQPGAASRWWLHHSLMALDTSLRELESGLVIRRGDSHRVLRELALETGAGLVCWNRLYEPASRNRDAHVQRALSDAGLQTCELRSSLLREPEEVLKDDGMPYRVYTPFSRRYLQEGLPKQPKDEPKELPPLPRDLPSLRVEDLELLSAIPWHSRFRDLWRPGESGAMAKLHHFLDQAKWAEYGQKRDLPGHDGISGLSPHLHFGEISAGQIWQAVEHAVNNFKGVSRREAAQKAWSFQRQLIWRDFAHHILYFHTQTPTEPFNCRYRPFGWEENPDLLTAWQKGETGIPLVDAGMRQLRHTGWMHNRLRMVVATVLCKHGLVHWLEGARWFWDTLVDADLANNTMGWQWTAGCGVDAAPYFRILNPVRQGKRFDPQGEYVRAWIPELASLPDRHIHEPWRAPSSVLQQAGVQLDINYPRPVVNLAEGRARALERFRALG